jgi:hypothetical protein
VEVRGWQQRKLRDQLDFDLGIRPAMRMQIKVSESWFRKSIFHKVKGA